MKPIELKYDNKDTKDTPKPYSGVEMLLGSVPRVTAVPTWTPRLFKDSFAVYTSGATYRLYVYDFTNSAWRFCALT